uniref:Rid family hydrolase n=1 Tax=Klebsiella variicola TaxID=244366 RepID=UPI0035649633
MGREIVLNGAESAPPAGHYSHSCSAGGFVWISGQLPVTPYGEIIAGAPFEGKRAARTVLTGMCYSVGSATRQGSSS